MKTWTTKNGYRIFLVLNGRSNAYLISKENINILVDTGVKSAFNLMRQNIDSLKLPNSKINLLVLTHTHYDHCQNAHRIKSDSHCKILMSLDEAKFVQHGYTPLPKGTFVVTNIVSSLGRLIGKRLFGYEPFTPDLVIDSEFDWFQKGFKLKFLITNGHSPGSISVIVDDEIAIVGDEMMGVYRNSVFTPFADDTTGMITSWGKLLKTGCEFFLPGHGKEVNWELLLKEYLIYARKRNIVT